MFNMAWFDQTPDDRVLQFAGWRDHVNRLISAAYLRADTNQDIVKAAFHRLMTKVPRADTPETVAALRRMLRVMSAFGKLSKADHDALHGRLPAELSWGKTGNELVALRMAREKQVWQSDPDLAEYRAEIDADIQRAAEDEQRKREADTAARREADQAKADAPGIVLAMAERGIRLDEQAGRVRAWPASKLTNAERDILANHNGAVLAAVKAEWTA